MARGIFITAKDLRVLEEITGSYAYKLLQTIRDSMGKEKTSKVTLKEYAKYRGIHINEVKEALKA